MSNFWNSLKAPTQANQILAKVDSHFGHFKKIRREPGQKPLETETKADKSRCIYMYLGNKGQGWRKRRGRGAYNPPDFRRIEGAAGQWHVASPHYYLSTQIFKPWAIPGKQKTILGGISLFCKKVFYVIHWLNIPYLVIALGHSIAKEIMNHSQQHIKNLLQSIPHCLDLDLNDQKTRLYFCFLNLNL